MKFSFSYKSYNRPFVKSLRTANGIWAAREGIFLKLESADRVAIGEVAPIPEFGTESLELAQAFITSLEIQSLEALKALEIPASLPCCAFAFSSIIKQLTNTSTPVDNAQLPVAALLPSGSEMPGVFIKKQSLGFRTFKWKIGVEALDLEFGRLQSVIEQISEGAVFRLDANGSLSKTDLEHWLRLCQPYKSKIEFFEQPLAVGQETDMASLSKHYGIPIALDESLNGPSGVPWFVPGTWAGPLVIKPCLLGNVDLQLKRYKKLPQQLVVSSSFESSVGLLECLRIALSCEARRYALGVDTRSAFNDGYGISESSPEIAYKTIEEHAKRLVDNEF